MGTTCPRPVEQNDVSSLSVQNFYFHFVIGRGGFGKVWKVESKKQKQLYALKEMSKSKIISKRSVQSVMNEKQLLSSLRHDFLINMIYAFSDRSNLYLVMDLLTGGDLRFHISRHRRFTEQQTKFFAACIVVGLEYLHQNGILHRDIKPENLVFDNKGYLRITDLGIARIWKPENSSDTSGTPGYMAPEVMCRQNHGVAVDYYALGIIVYECMMGRRPYLGRTRQEIRDQILARQVQIKKSEVPDKWSLEAADFCNRLIQRKPMNRLGLNGPEEVKNHPWFKGFPWQKLINKEIEPPYVPSQTEENYHANVDRKDSNPDINGQNELMLRRNSVQSMFDGYEYDCTKLNFNNQNPLNMINNSTNVSTRFNSARNSKIEIQNQS
ncbi:Serine/Threonine kinase domain protein (macronuclear) [Tetrahymena thermophila SB210]|uniref:non-specific serine/threonine protein kinase n=1 Tax=Tetrahymena thermophila (strain SB210) TaxID=312017 RepID=Q22GZ5_TETTS|nr:Serine/Threonine kinase domain protein [Tetrahymena thermophila SB210]EAR84529.3 Serine/Threonine kinase domain protein [Tetrahymena thermophila SB210]|eukprot:XP_001032192.3 Serine/Threonine kinase domain protein [Tetrahymena thermophila SB210]